MRPYIICHMLSSVDGKIDSAALQSVTGKGEYEATGGTLRGDAWICGRTTMQQHFAEDEPFVSGFEQAGRASARPRRSPGRILRDLGRYRWQASLAARRCRRRSPHLCRE